MYLLQKKKNETCEYMMVLLWPKVLIPYYLRKPTIIYLLISKMPPKKQIYKVLQLPSRTFQILKSLSNYFLINGMKYIDHSIYTTESSWWRIASSLSRILGIKNDNFFSHCCKGTVRTGMVCEFLRGCFLVWVGGLPKRVIYLESEWKGLCDRVRGLCLLALSLFLRVLWLCFGSLES